MCENVKTFSSENPTLGLIDSLSFFCVVELWGLSLLQVEHKNWTSQPPLIWRFPESGGRAGAGLTGCRWLDSSESRAQGCGGESQLRGAFRYRSASGCVRMWNRHGQETAWGLVTSRESGKKKQASCLVSWRQRGSWSCMLGWSRNRRNAL